MLNSGINVLFEGRNLARLMEGLLVSGRIALISVTISALLGTIFGILMLSNKKPVKILARTYLESIRIIPIIVWLFIMHFGITRAVGLHLSAEAVAIFVFSLWGVAEMGDLVRGALQSLPVHQRESAVALGLNRYKLYRFVLIPQAVRRLLPSAMNLVTRMVKTTSLVVLIGVIDVVKVGQQIIEISQLKNPTASFWVFGFIFFLYFALCYPISVLSRRLEKKWEG